MMPITTHHRNPTKGIRNNRTAKAKAKAKAKDNPISPKVYRGNIPPIRLKVWQTGKNGPKRTNG